MAMSIHRAFPLLLLLSPPIVTSSFTLSSRFSNNGFHLDNSIVAFTSQQSAPTTTTTNRPHPFVRCISTHLEAKKKKKNAKKSSPGGGSGSGGFGRRTNAVAAATKQKPRDPTAADRDDDYSAFPPLEPNVKSTLQSPPPVLYEESGVLPDEMYDRLEQIYGFEYFNYPSGEGPTKVGEDDEDEEEGGGEEGMSLEDLIGVAGGSGAAGAVESSATMSTDFGDILSSSGTKTSSSSSSSLDLADLIASATGGEEPTLQKSASSYPEKGSGTVAVPPLPSLQNLSPFTDFRVLHVDPMVLAIDNFFTSDECDRYVSLSSSSQPPPSSSTNVAKEARENDVDSNPLLSQAVAPSSDNSQTGGSSSSTRPVMEIQSKTVGKDSRSKAQRTSTTWFHHYEGVPELMAKASRLLGLTGIERWEEPQTVRYRQSEKFTWHLDALAPSAELSKLGGQRIATLLVYLTDVQKENGGATVFRDLGGGDKSDDGGGYLKVQPKKGTALLFFPAAGGIPNTPFDVRTLHAGEAVSNNSPTDKWIAQLWLREGQYQPTAPPGNTHGMAFHAIEEYCNNA